jgi:hypothetical protein
MNLLKKTDEEILEIANPLWDDLVRNSNKQDYFEFVKNFSAKMLFGANEIEIGKQWANNKLLTSLSEERTFLGCIRRNDFVTVLFKQKSNVVTGDFLGRLVIGIEDKEIKIFGATIF